MLEEETRLVAELKRCHWLSRFASDALTRPMYRVIGGSAAHHKLIEADRAAREQYETARTALHAWRNPEPHVSGASVF